MGGGDNGEKMDKIEREIEKENMLDKIEGLNQEWRVIAQKGNTKVLGLYKNYIGWEKNELAEIRIKFEDDDE